MSKFYVTTPIYYVNDQPHIGHAYTSLAADVLAEYHRMKGDRVFFLTGTDEHGQKVEQAAATRGRSPQEHADLMVENFQALWKKLELSHGAFIRTTDPAHKSVVRELLQDLWERGEIVKRTYSGWYCTPCERFWTGKDLEEHGGNCPDCGRPVEQIDEDNYFFLMSKYGERLREHIETHPAYILPETRRNEVLGFLRAAPLGDLCISRPKHRLSWGVPLPFDEEYVTYVWFDALINYFSATRNLAPEVDGGWWPASVHLIGKDILTTHAVYWSAMLMAMGLPLPGTIYAHGWWTIEGRKMSKSLGNVVDPAEMVERFGTDAFRFFLFREVPFGGDGDFSEHALIARINTDLANDLGNLASRSLKMAGRYCGGMVPGPGEAGGEEAAMRAIAAGIPAAMDREFGVLRFQHAIEECWKLVSYTNKYIDTNAPWQLAKDPALEGRLHTVLYHCLEALRVLAVCLRPFMPNAMTRLYAGLGAEGDVTAPGALGLAEWGGLKPGAKLTEMDALFPRIETKKQQEQQEEKPKKEKKKPMTEEKKDVAAPESDGLIKIDDFMKVELKTARILEAERVEKSDKLIRLQVDSGERRQIVAGIGNAYAPEDLIGKTVIVVANLKPAKLMGNLSEGMLLAATGEDGRPIILAPEEPVPPGVRVK